jgi:hypothetical protein
MDAGQFSIFGAVEEKGRQGFRGSTRMKQRLSDVSFLLWMMAVLAWREEREENLVEWAAGISTAGAQEMQKAVAKEQWLVVSGSSCGRVFGVSSSLRIHIRRVA